MKKLLIAALFPILSTASANEVEANLPVVCYPTPHVISRLGDFKVLMMDKNKEEFKTATVVDRVIYSKTVNAIFVVRENTQVNYSCIISMFEKTDANTFKGGK